MPIEQELKLVLVPDEKKVLSFFLPRMRLFQKSEIEQIYLNDETRVRHRRFADSEEFWFTFKKTISDNQSVEIEQQISSADFELLKAKSIGQLFKHRYSSFLVGCTLDLDIFFHDQKVYFCMLEIEYVDQPDLSWIPKKMILKKVKKNSEFSSRKLCDVNYAKRKLEKL